MNDRPANAFGSSLTHYREKHKRSVGELAQEVGIDRAWLYRLETQPFDALNTRLGSSSALPSRDLVIRIALVLKLALDEADDLLVTAGYAPLYLPR